MLEGAADAAQDLADTFEALRGQLRHVTIAKVVPFEAVEHVGDNLMLVAAIADLRGAAATLPDVRPELIVLPAHPSTAPQHFARRRAIDLVLHAHDVPASVAHQRQ